MDLRSRIIGTGRALPERVVANRELERTLDTSDTWIRERTGVRERRVLGPEWATSDLATEAGRQACQAAGVEPAEIDCIVLATVTPDVPLPATAAYVQRKLGARAGGAAFDISAACAGFLYALGVADGFIGRGMFRRVLVIGVEVLSRIVDPTDRNTAVLFGDGAGAVVLVPEAGARGVLSTHLFADGKHTDILHIPGGGTRLTRSGAALDQRQHFVHMNGREVYQHAVRNMAAAAKIALEANQLEAADLAWVIPHQANHRIIEAVAERLELSLERFIVNLDRYGNTSSASLPIALSEAVDRGQIKDGDLVLLTALGGGLAWGSALIRW
jgi:3-oxoacyl-[acyl-carrier-protein] synthase-3